MLLTGYTKLLADGTDATYRSFLLNRSTTHYGQLGRIEEVDSMCFKMVYA